MTVQIFVDESKRNGFVMAAAGVSADSVAKYRKQLRRCLKPGVRRFHCTSATDSERRQVIALISAWPATVDIFVSDSRSESVSRHACLSAVAVCACDQVAGRLVIEADHSHDRADRNTLTMAMRDQQHSVRWDLASPNSEELLWVPDAVAWCWTHPSSKWRSLVDPLVRSVTQL